MDTPEEAFSLRQMAPARRRAGLIVGLAVGGVALAAAAAAGITYAVTRQTGTSTPASPATPVANGIARPDATCVQTDGTDHQDYWNGNGWWAGRIDGEAKEMPALNVLSLKLQGHQINSVWICAPRANG